MKLRFLELCGFRGFQKTIRIDFSKNFTIIDGRNGSGKSTVFDAVEFALTGTISKYQEAKAAQESVDNYLWWHGEGDVPDNRYVKIGFVDADGIHTIKRTPFGVQNGEISVVHSRLVDRDFAPEEAIPQLCRSTIIRDEHIARYSLDLKETERFNLVHDAIGAVDAEQWKIRASQLLHRAQQNRKALQQELQLARDDFIKAVKRFDEVQALEVSSAFVEESVLRLQSMLDSGAKGRKLTEMAMTRLIDIETSIEGVEKLLSEFSAVEETRNALMELEDRIVKSRDDWKAAKKQLQDEMKKRNSVQLSTDLSEQAREFSSLANLGKAIGRRNGHCPLCASQVGESQFESGIHEALAFANQLDKRAVEQENLERTIEQLEEYAKKTKILCNSIIESQRQAVLVVKEFDSRIGEQGLRDPTAKSLQEHVVKLRMDRNKIVRDLKILQTIPQQGVVKSTDSARKRAKEHVKRMEILLGRARLSETKARAIYDATIRAAAESVDLRLDRVLPLMSELYARLRPHPVWGDIEYRVRGDVQRFLRFTVGNNVNPQFVFSSGQRRVTGLAFLLSINLSIAWSRWRSILLDDPVQHVDDFRTVHLAEVLAHLYRKDQQIVCAVEDKALADMMCRRLASSEEGSGNRITLGNDENGCLAVIRAQKSGSLKKHALVHSSNSLSA